MAENTTDSVAFKPKNPLAGSMSQYGAAPNSGDFLPPAKPSFKQGVEQPPPFVQKRIMDKPMVNSVATPPDAEYDRYGGGKSQFKKPINTANLSAEYDRKSPSMMDEALSDLKNYYSRSLVNSQTKAVTPTTVAATTPTQKPPTAAPVEVRPVQIPKATATQSSPASESQEIPLQAAAGQSNNDKFIDRVALDSSIKAIPVDAITRTKQIGDIAVDQVLGANGKPIAVSFDNGKGKIQWGDASGYNQAKKNGTIAVTSNGEQEGVATVKSADTSATKGAFNVVTGSGVTQQTNTDTRTPPQEESFQQSPIKSNVLGGYQDSEDFKRAVKESQKAILNGIRNPKSTGAVKAAQIAEDNLKTLFGFDVQGNQKTQLEQQQLEQSDLAQRRDQRTKHFASLLGADESGKTLAQRQAEQAQNAQQFAVKTGLENRELDIKSQAKKEDKLIEVGENADGTKKFELEADLIAKHEADKQKTESLQMQRIAKDKESNNPAVRSAAIAAEQEMLKKVKA